MNKFFSLITMMLCYMASVAQTANEHLTFKGVPIDGTLSEFVSKMKSAGFSYIGTQDGMAILQGDFAGYKGCIIGVNTLKSAGVVSTIGVIFPSKDDWSLLEADYILLKELLTKKYGEPSECIEQFQYYKTPEDNNTKLHCLKMDECTYSTTFVTENGEIKLSLEHVNVLQCFVKLQYWDRINTDEVKAKVMDDL